MRSRAVALAALLAVALGASACTSAQPAVPAPATTTASAAPDVISSVAVVGDSMSVGVSACGNRDECPEASWATGSDPAIGSIAQRLAEASGVTPDTVVIARPGARVADRIEAVSRLDERPADLVLVLVGGNDACAAEMDQITEPAEFARRYATLLSDIRAKAPAAPIVAYSLPNLMQLWELGRTNPEAVSRWNSSASCRTLLGDADSDASSDVDRRAFVVDTLEQYNVAIADACAQVAGCTTDDGAVFDTTYTPDEVSTVDYFHASAAGQAVLAERAWPAVEAALR